MQAYNPVSSVLHLEGAKHIPSPDVSISRRSGACWSACALSPNKATSTAYPNAKALLLGRSSIPSPNRTDKALVKHLGRRWKKNWEAVQSWCTAMEAVKGGDDWQQALIRSWMWRHKSFRARTYVSSTPNKATGITYNEGEIKSE